MQASLDRVLSQTAAGEDGMGGMVPSVDYALMGTTPSRDDPAEQPVTFTVQHTLGPMYGPGSAGPMMDARVVVVLLARCLPVATTLGGRVGILATSLNVLVPGLPARLGWVGTYVTDRGGITRYMYEMTAGFTDAGVITTAEIDERVVNSPFDEFGWGVVHPIEGVDVELIAHAVLGLLLFAAYKGVSSANASAFTTNRPTAAAAAIGMGSLPANATPGLDCYRVMSSVLSSPELRVSLFTELTRWIQRCRGSPGQSAIVSQVRLARRSGLGGYELVVRIMRAYGAVLRRVDHLRGDIRVFRDHDESVRRLSADRREFDHLIYGSRSLVLAQGDYGDLIMVAKEIARASHGTFVNFGRQVPAALTAEIRRVAASLGVALIGLPQTA